LASKPFPIVFRQSQTEIREVSAERSHSDLFGACYLAESAGSFRWAAEFSFQPLFYPCPISPLDDATSG
jgi:hypothetical protein